MTEPQQGEERRATLEDPLAQAPAPRHGQQGTPGLFARLRRPDGDRHDPLGREGAAGSTRIVRQKELATNASAGSQRDPGPGLFNVTATTQPGRSVADLEAAIDTEIEKVKTGPIADWELEKARRPHAAATSTV